MFLEGVCMWQKKAYQPNDIVSISFTAEMLACAWLRPSIKSLMYELKAYKRVSLNHFEIAEGYIHNPTLLGKHISSFFEKHKLEGVYVSFGIQGAALYETIIHLPTANPDPCDIIVPKKQQHVWMYRYLYPEDNGHAAFYVCSIAQSLLLQYKLLAFRQHLNLLGITTVSMAYIHAYAHAYGNAFRHSQLGQDMVRHRHQFGSIVPADIMRRRLKVAAPYAYTLEHELSVLTPLLGLAVSERESL